MVKHLRLKRPTVVETVLGIALGAVAIVAILATAIGYVPHTQKYPYIPAVNAIGVSAERLAPGEATTPGSRIPSIQVLSWHQIDNGCQPTSLQCSSPEYSETNVTQLQFYNELSWLYSHGYRTITTAQYVKWATSQDVMLPAKPVLLTVDDGIANFYGPATPILEHFGYTMVSFVVSGYAQGAQDGVPENEGWDATWTQLQNLPPGTWEFAFHAGPHGHEILANDSCPYFYVCPKHGKFAAFKASVKADINAGIAAEQQQLGSRVNTQMWAVPFNDLAQPSGGPHSGGAKTGKWLQAYAAKKFAVVFVDGQVSQANQHYRYEVHGADTLAFFAQQVQESSYYTSDPSPATANARAGGQN